MKDPLCINSWTDDSISKEIVGLPLNHYDTPVFLYPHPKEADTNHLFPK